MEPTVTQDRIFEWASLPHGWLVFLAIALAVGVAYYVFALYRAESRSGTSLTLRQFLGALRCTVLAGLALILLEPIIATYREQTTNGQVIVLRDVSASMQIRDRELPTANATEDATRLTAVSDLLQSNDAAFLKSLSENNEVRLYNFGESARRVATDATNPDPSATNETESPANTEIENATDITGAIASALSDVASNPIAGVIIFSDGIANRGAPLAAAAAKWQSEGVRIFTVGVGSDEEPPNLRIASLNAPELTSLRDPYEVTAEIVSATELPDEEIEIELIATSVSDDNQTPTTLGTQRITMTDADQPQRVAFEVAPEAAGEYVLTARLSELDREADRADNERTTVVTVRDAQDRVLIVAGSPSYEYRYLTRLLERDDSIEVSCWLQSADVRAVRDGDTIITELPRTADELFAYDAIILLDPYPDDFDSAFAATLRRFVSEFQGGILLAAGPHFTSRFLNDDRLQTFVDILPFTPEKSAAVLLQSQSTYRTDAWPYVLPPAARNHALVRLSDDAQANDEIWSALPQGWWRLPLAAPKPLANVLLQAGATGRRSANENEPLLVTQTVGVGKTAVLAFDGTWRWRATAEPYYNKFWVEMVRFLTTGRKETANRRGTIVLDRNSVQQNDYVKVDVRVLDDEFVPWYEPTTPVRVEDPDGTLREFQFAAMPDQPGWFSGRVQFNSPGAAIIHLPLPGTVPEEIRKTVRVQAEVIEMKRLRRDADALKSLATKTGGGYFTLATANEIPDQISSATVTATARDPDPETLWDRGWILLTLAGLLTIEWSLRRAYSLL